VRAEVRGFVHLTVPGRREGDDPAGTAADAVNATAKVSAAHAHAATDVHAATAAETTTKATGFGRRRREDGSGTDRGDRGQSKCGIAKVKHGSLQEVVGLSSDLLASISSRRAGAFRFMESGRIISCNARSSGVHLGEFCGGDHA
jgi:hypothetical protein